MIDLYGMSSPNALKIVLMLEETGLPYRFHWIDVWKGEQFSPELRDLNPNAKVPVIVDEDGPGGRPFPVFESGAILLYLAEKSGQLLPKDAAARYEVLQWLMVQLTGVGPMFGQRVHFTRFAPEDQDYARSRYTTEVLRLVSLLEARLGKTAYLGGADYSIADVATYPWLRSLTPLGLKPEDYPNLSRWITTIAARPAAGRLLAKLEEWTARNTASLSSAAPDDLDRMFGRGKFARTAA
jgi:GST-like protein